MDGGVAADGRILVLVSAWGGSSFCGESYTAQKLWRFRGDGRLDRSFGVDGRARVTVLNARAVAPQASGRALVMGEGCLDLDDPAMDLGFSLARYRADGSLDERFGDHGVVVNLIDGELAVPADLALPSNDRVLVLGHTVDAELSPDDLAIARYIAA
jgi:hypothetical protein